jgi:hypothetical protein
VGGHRREPNPPIQVNPPLSEPEIVNGADYLNEALIEKLWHELSGQATREQIRQVAVEVATQFQNATVKTFIPVFVYRQTYEKLKSGLGELVD